MNELDRYLHDFGERLAVAPPPRRRRARRPLIAAVAVTVAAVAALLVLDTGGRKLDVVAEARAALVPHGEIVHMVIRAEGPPGTIAPPTVEQWSAVDPLRWRLVEVIPDPKQNRGGMMDKEGRFWGRYESGYGNGRFSTYVAMHDTLRVSEGYSDRDPEATAPGLVGDPESGLPALLASGKLSDAGEREIGGRTVRRLVGKRLRQPIAYDVDPVTFAPVQMTVGEGDTGLRFVVASYERIPITPETVRLLAIQTSPKTKVIVSGR